MALYVHPENQEILWNIMNQNPYLNSMLSYQSPEQKQEWFKGIIQTFYQQNSHKTLDKSQLNQLNKDTLTYMISYAKAIPSPSTMESSYLTQKNQRTVETFQPKIATPPIVPDNRADIFNQQFTARQKEYETMLDKKPPAEPDFKEPDADGVISNMDELIKRHMEERDAQLQQYAPKSPTVPAKPIQQESSAIPIQQVATPIQQVVTEQAKENIILKEENPLEEQVIQLSDKITILLDEIQVLNKKVDILLHKNTSISITNTLVEPVITASGDDN